MAASEKDREEIFYEAFEILDPGRRAAYLDEACGSNPELRARVEALLKAHECAGDFLKTPAVAGETLEGSAHLEGPGTVIGHYELLELTGEGGMGLVYLAEQKEPVRRRVALKIIKPGMDSRQVIARFEAERQALAVLDHPNIAHVFDAGTTDTGRPYFVMEYVRGMSITRYCDENKLTIEQRLRLFEQVCEAVQHAHQKGIIHRDLKPSNILVSLHGDRAVPKIIDFGIAKAITQPLTDKTFATLQGHLLGTPEYMSPEQVDLATQDIDTRSDIYSLGVVLYELLAGVLPFETEAFERAGLAEIQQTIREMEPTSPSLRLTGLGEEAHVIAARRGTQVIPLARRLHRELEWIPLKAMRKDRCRRYRSASEMADDVRNYLAGVPLIAGPETTIYRVQKFVRKHAGSVMTVALVATAIVLGLVVSIWQAKVATDAKDRAIRSEVEKDRQAQIAVEERDKALVAQRQSATAQQQAEQQRQRAEASEKEAQNLLYAANMNLAQYACEQNNMGRLRQLLEETANYPRRGFEWYYWQRYAHREIRTFRLHSFVLSVAFSPDGRRIVTGSYDATARVWDAVSGEEVLSLQHAHPVGMVAFSPSGQRIVTCSVDWFTDVQYAAQVWDAKTGKELLTFKGHGAHSAAFSPDGRRIVTGGHDGTAKVWDADTGRQLLTIYHPGGIASVTFSPDGRQVCTTSDQDKTAKTWDAKSGKELLTLQSGETSISSAEFSPDGKQIVTSNARSVNVWDANSGKELFAIEGHGIGPAVFSPDSQRIARGCTDGTTKLWDATSGKELLILRGHTKAVCSVAFSPDGRRVVTASADETATIWHVVGGNEGLTFRAHDSRVMSVAFSPDGQQILTGSEDEKAKVWDATNGQEIFSLRGHNERIWSAAFSPDHRRIVTGSIDKTAKVWDADGGEELFTLRGHSGGVLTVAFSPDGDRIVTGSFDGTAKVWEVDSGKELLILKWHDGPIYGVAFSPDGRRIVTGSGDQTAKIWDADSGEELHSFAGHDYLIWSVTFSPDGKQVMTASGDGTVKVWESASGRELLTLKGHGDQVFFVASSPDGQRLLTAGLDKTARIWSAADGRELLALAGHKGAIQSAAFSPDGRRIVTGDSKGIVKVWNAASSEQVTGWQQEERADAERQATLARQRAIAAERAKALRVEDPGAIKQWLVLAPLSFSGQNEAAALAALGQQQMRQEGTLHPHAGQQVKIGDIERTWKTIRQQDYRIDFNRLLGEPTSYSVAYAVCYINSEAVQTDLLMKVGSGGDPLKVYLNGQEIHRRERATQNYVWSETDVTGIRLEAGLNVLVLKVVNLAAEWRGSIWLTDAAGLPVEGIHVTLEAPEEVQP